MVYNDIIIARKVFTFSNLTPTIQWKTSKTDFFEVFYVFKKERTI